MTYFANKEIKNRQRIIRNLGLLAVIVTAIFGVDPLPQEVTAERVVPAAERPPMFVLQVGIGKYLHGPIWAELRGAVTDVVEMRKLLEGDRYRVPSLNIKTLTDQEGTKQEIIKQFQDHLIAKAGEYKKKTGKRDAVVLFQFSGHGSQVPDTDKDEDDGKDETLVTYASEDVAGKNFDITDDEIYGLTSQLRQYTDNIVYILDSCHSGSGTRNAEDARRLPARTTTPEPFPGLAIQMRSGEKKADDGENSDLLPPGDDYIVITAARSEELATQKYCFEECGNAREPIVYGILTFYLIDELRNARSDTSYREVMENVVRRVSSEKPSQTPQIEGDKQRIVFGSLGSREDNFTRIIENESKDAKGMRSIRIKAGGMQGVSVGTIVDVFDKGVTRFDQAEKIASGTLVKVLPGESTIQLINARREVTTNDKAVIVAPGLGSLRLKVNLDTDGKKFADQELKVVSEIRKSLTLKTTQTKDSRGVDLVNEPTAGRKNETKWDVALVKDKFSNVASKIPGGSDPSFFCEHPNIDDGKETEKGYRKKTFDEYKREVLAAAKNLSPGRDVFYLTGGDYVPLYRFCMETTFMDEQAQTRAATRLEEAFVHMARLKTVNGIANNHSLLKGKIIVRPIRLTGFLGCTNSVLKFRGNEAVEADNKTGMFNFTRSEIFWFEVVNNSPKDLYVTLLNMGPKGDVTLLFPRKTIGEQNGVMIPRNGGRRIVNGDDCRLNSENKVDDSGAFVPALPTGIEKYKFIFTTDRTLRSDFEYLEMTGLERTSGAPSLAAKSDWTTVDIVFKTSEVNN